MLCRDTVEDVIMRRAAHKLRLSQVREQGSTALRGHIALTGCAGWGVARDTHRQAVMAATDTGGSGSADARQQPTVAELISALKVRKWTHARGRMGIGTLNVAPDPDGPCTLCLMDPARCA